MGSQGDHDRTHVSKQLNTVMHLVNAPTQKQVTRGDGLLRRRREATLVNPILEAVQVHRRIRLRVSSLEMRGENTRKLGRTYWLTKPLFGKSLTIGV